MRDAAFLSLAIGVFLIGVLYVSACGRILGSEGAAQAQSEPDPRGSTEAGR
jgi:hypothetical protein